MSEETPDPFSQTLHPTTLEQLMADPERRRFEIDHFVTAIRAGKTWLLYRRQPNGWLKRIDSWTGTRRSIFSVLSQLGIEPSRAAEEQLGEVTETDFLVDEKDEAEEPA